MPTNESNPVASDAPDKNGTNGTSQASPWPKLGVKVLEFLKWTKKVSFSATSKTIVFFLLLFGAGAFVTYKATTSYFEAGMIGLGAMALGFLVGFLFGIPRSPGSMGQGAGGRSRQEEDEEEPGQGRKSVAMGNDRPTNLEDISDWLSKVLIGAGLVGLKDGVIYLQGMAGKISTELGGEAAGLESFAMALMIYFFSLGLLFSYIVTRIYLTNAFARARQQMLALVEEWVDSKAESQNGPEVADLLQTLRRW